VTDGEIYRIEIPVEVQDQTEPALGQAQQKISKFEERMQKTEERIQRMNKTRLQLLMSAIDKASGVIDYIGAKARTLIKKPWQMTVHVIDMATRPLRSIFNFATSIQGIITGIIAGAAAQKLVAGPMALADSLAQAEVGFETMLGSAEKAKKMMTDIKQFAIKTPFETNEIIDQTQRMMAMGWAAEDVLRDMERIGNAAAATGKGALGMDRVILALGQIRMKGKLSAEELNQLAEAGIRAREYIAKGLGVDIPTAMSMAEKGMIDANKAIDMILKGMDEFDGQMDKTANRTVKGLISQIKDAFSVSVFERWGKGLQRGAISGLVKFNDWISNNRSTLDKWGESLEKIGETISTAIVNKLDSLSRRANDVFNSDAFKNVTRLSDKIKIAWDKIVAEPFQEWWNGPGQKKITAMAESIGRALGGGIGGFIMSALGVASDPKKLAKESPFLSAGATAGKAFLDAFLEAFDAQKIAQKAVDAFKSLIKDAGKFMPGGEKPSSTSWISAALVSILGWKLGGKTLITKGLPKIGKFLFKNANKVDDVVKATKAAGVAADATPTAAKAVKSIPIFGANGQVIKTVVQNADEAAKVAEVAGTISKSTKGVGLLGKLGSVSKYLSKVGKGIKGIPIVGTALGLLGSGVTVATASPENRGREVAGEAGSWIGSLGAGAAAGALVGTLGGGPIGTAIGAAVGGIGGAIGGEAFTEWLYDQKDAIAQWGSDVGKWFGDTWSGIKQGASDAGQWIGSRFNDAKSWVQDKWSSVSTWFSDNVGTPIKNGFINATNFTVGLFDMAREGISNAMSPIVGWLDTNVWQPIKGATQDVANWIGQKWDEAKTWAQNTWSTVAGWFDENVWTPAKNAAAAAGSWIGQKLDEAKLWAQNAWSSVTGWFDENVWVPVKSAAESVGNWIGEKWNNAKTWVQEAWGTASSWLDENVWSPVKDGAKAAADWISDKFSKAKSWVQEKWSGFTGWFKQNIAQPVSDFVSSATERGSKITGLKAHAAGGIMTTPHVGLVAEAGPEAIIPLSPSRRSRGLTLWQKVGEILGARPYAEGGILGQINSAIAGRISKDETESDKTFTPRPAGVHATKAKSHILISVQSTPAPVFRIETAQDGKSVIEVIRSNIQTITDELSDEMAEKLIRIFQNMPEVEGV
jgi:tape measure domain-containing protein